MGSRSSDLDGHTLLAITAHPDDEAILCGGLLAWSAARGVNVNLLCLTRGEHAQGEGDVGQRRRDELAAAASVLGIASTTLLTHEDGMLPWLDAALLERDIAAAIDRQHPHVIVTFDQDGVYGHPDHIAVYERTTAAVGQLRERAPALFYATTPPGSMRALVDHVTDDCRARGMESAPPSAILGVDDPDAWGAAGLPPTVVIDAQAFGLRKLEALRCHHSQFHDSALAFVTEADAPRLLGTEHYRRAPVGGKGVAFIESLGRTRR